MPTKGHLMTREEIRFTSKTCLAWWNSSIFLLSEKNGGEKRFHDNLSLVNQFQVFLKTWNWVQIHDEVAPGNNFFWLLPFKRNKFHTSYHQVTQVYSEIYIIKTFTYNNSKFLIYIIHYTIYTLHNSKFFWIIIQLYNNQHTH